VTVPDPGEPAEWLAITGPSLAGYLAAAIEAFWLAATPLHLAVPADGNGICPADVALLRLLATGTTQQDAARRMHLSERTISRRVAYLKQRLDATSALQAGLEAARRGLI
jgi:DNA-binding NarL/FixJ family response regulator